MRVPFGEPRAQRERRRRARVGGTSTTPECVVSPWSRSGVVPTLSSTRLHVALRSRQGLLEVRTEITTKSQRNHYFGSETGKSYGEWISSLACRHVRNGDHGGGIGGIEWGGSGVRRLWCPRSRALLRPSMDGSRLGELRSCRRSQDARAAGRRLGHQSTPRPDRRTRREPVRGRGRRRGHRRRLRDGH